MSLCVVRYRSEALQMATSMHIILPEKGEGPFPVFYLLHGLSDDDSIWERRTRIEWFVRDLPLIVVMPNGNRGFYTDAVDGGPAHEKHIIQDVIGWVDKFLPTRRDRKDRFIGGLSMGGYGALKLALKYPCLFGAVDAHSSAIFPGHAAPPPDRPPETRTLFLNIFGPEPSGGENDLYALAERIDRTMLPAIRMDCGTEDYLIDQNRAFHAHLQALGIPHEYAEFPGAHNWDFWNEHIQDGLRFLWRVMET